MDYSSFQRYSSGQPGKAITTMYNIKKEKENGKKNCAKISHQITKNVFDKILHRFMISLGKVVYKGHT